MKLKNKLLLILILFIVFFCLGNTKSFAYSVYDFDKADGSMMYLPTPNFAFGNTRYDTKDNYIIFYGMLTTDSSSKDEVQRYGYYCFNWYNTSSYASSAPASVSIIWSDVSNYINYFSFRVPANVTQHYYYYNVDSKEWNLGGYLDRNKTYYSGESTAILACDFNCYGTRYTTDSDFRDDKGITKTLGFQPPLPPQEEQTPIMLTEVTQLPEVIVATMKIIIPVGLIILGIFLVIYLVRLVIWRLQ